MKAKIEYNPDEPNGRLYYMEFDVMLIFPYEYYKRDAVTAINISVDFDETFIKRRDEILNFIGHEVAIRQSMPSYYKITNTSIEIREITVFYRMKSWPIQGLLSILLLIFGIYMAFKGIVFGKELVYTNFHRRGLVPIPGPLVIIVAIIWLVSVYFKRKSTLK